MRRQGFAITPRFAAFALPAAVALVSGIANAQGLVAFPVQGSNAINRVQLLAQGVKGRGK